MFCSTNIINYTFVIEILRKLYVSWSNNSERDTTRRFKLNGGKEKNKIRKKKVPLYTSVEQLEIKVLEMLRCFFQRCMVDSRMIIDAFRNVESRRNRGGRDIGNIFGGIPARRERERERGGVSIEIAAPRAPARNARSRDYLRVVGS